MALPVKCKTCDEEIIVREGAAAGPAVRRHYWEKHPETMNRTKAQIEATITAPAD